MRKQQPVSLPCAETGCDFPKMMLNFPSISNGSTMRFVGIVNSKMGLKTGAFGQKRVIFSVDLRASGN